MAVTEQKESSAGWLWSSQIHAVTEQKEAGYGVPKSML
jgi:hypothetical protein